MDGDKNSSAGDDEHHVEDDEHDVILDTLLGFPVTHVKDFIVAAVNAFAGERIIVLHLFK